MGTDSGIFRSTDNGTSWSPVSPAVVHAFSFDTKTAPSTVYADGFKSIDSGATFTAVPGVGTFLADPRATNAVFRLTTNIGAAQNMTWSRDGGATAIPFNKGLGEIITTQGFSGQAFVLLPTSPNEMVCVLSITHGIVCNSVTP